MSKKDTPDYIFKLLCLGETGVGKTCVILRYSDNKFTKHQMSTVGIDFKIKVIEYKTKQIKLIIWDTAGQERFRNITNQYYNGADGIILIYDVTNRNSFNNVTYWINQITSKSDRTKIGLILVGNKTDDEKSRVITKEEGEILGQNNEIDFIKTSVFKNKKIDECFNCVINKIIKKKGIVIEQNKTEENRNNIKLNNIEGNEFNPCQC